MKKIILMSIVFVLLVFVGCSESKSELRRKGFKFWKDGNVSFGDIAYEGNMYSSNYIAGYNPIGIVVYHRWEVNSADFYHYGNKQFDKKNSDNVPFIVHLQQSNQELKWCNRGADARRGSFPTSENDGSKNWKMICSNVSDENIKYRYPAFDYINSLGKGWYMPSKWELNIIVHNRKLRDKLDKLLSYGLKVNTVNYKDIYWSSSSVDNGRAYIDGSSMDEDRWYDDDRVEEHYVRAVRHCR